MLIVSHAVFFHAKISQCVCSLWFYFLFLCWYLAFFNQLIIIVLCSFDSRQFPEINEKKKTKTQLLFPKRGGWCTAGRCQSVAAAPPRTTLTGGKAIYGEDDSPDRACSSIFNHADEFFYSPKSGVISIQMTSGAPLLIAAVLPMDRDANVLLAAHRCNKRRMGGKRSWERGPESSPESGGNRRWVAPPPSFPFRVKSGLCESARPNEIPARAAYGRVMSHSMAAAPVLAAHFYTVHISCKWAFAELVINSQ